MWRRADGRENALTPREREILGYLREGLSDRDIAGRLDTSPATASYQVARLLEKLGLGSREAVATLAPGGQQGQLETPQPQAGSRMGRWLRPTRLKLALFAIVAVVGGLYAWGIFLSGNDSAEGAIAVQWLQVDPPLLEVQEQARPYFAAARAIGSEDVWRVYVVVGDGEPRLALESNRQLLSTSWSPDGGRLSIGFLSQGLSGEPLTGTLTVDASTHTQLWERLLPQRVSTRFPAGGDRIAWVDTRPGPGNSALYVIEANGVSRRLSAPWDYVAPGPWSPDGRRLLVQAIPTGDFVSESTRYFVVSPDETRAVFVGRFRFPPAWSPDGRSLAGLDGAELIIVDVERRAERRVPLAATAAEPASGQPLFSPQWSAGGDLVSYAGAVVEAGSGRLLARTEPSTTLSSVSPDGRWVVVASDFSVCPSPGTRLARANQTALKEVATGRWLPLLSCSQGSHTSHHWLSPTTLLLAGSACPAPCTRAALSLALVTLPDARVRFLSDGADVSGAGIAVAPGSQRVLVGGRTLQLLASDGSLLRTIPAAEGLQASAASWSADGRAYAYIVGPNLRGTAGPAVASP